jgi:hypothetical protein
LKTKTPAILDFDIENRPLSYLGMDFTTCEVTAIACGWTDSDFVACYLLDGSESSARWMLQSFCDAYNRADIVTGHYIRKHDLPIINGALLELDMKPLGPKLTIDTKLDLKRHSGVSKSQESLSAMLGIEADKEHMTQADWRSANRLTLAGLERTRTRCVGDVVQHKQLRIELTRRGLLGPPKIWRP